MGRGGVSYGLHHRRGRPSGAGAQIWGEAEREDWKQTPLENAGRAAPQQGVTGAGVRKGPAQSRPRRAPTADGPALGGCEVPCGLPSSQGCHVPGVIKTRRSVTCELCGGRGSRVGAVSTRQAVTHRVRLDMCTGNLEPPPGNEAELCPTHSTINHQRQDPETPFNNPQGGPGRRLSGWSVGP